MNLWKLTGGRPMRLEQRSLFVDVVSGKTVHGYRDRLGRRFMAEHSCALFRVPRAGVDRDKWHTQQAFG